MKQPHTPCEFEERYRDKIEERLDRIGADVQALREKVFNGLSELPEEIRWIRRLLVGLLVSAVLAAGTSAWANAQTASRFERLLEKTRTISESVSP